MKKLSMLAIAGLSLLASNVMAAVKSEAVQYEHDGTKLTGHLYYDDAKTDKRPGVMVVHEWWGLNDYAKNVLKCWQNWVTWPLLRICTAMAKSPTSPSKPRNG